MTQYDTGGEVSQPMFSLADLFGLYGRVEELMFSDTFHRHQQERAGYGKHRVSLSEILQVHQSSPRYFLNEGSTPSETGRSLMSADAGTGRELSRARAPIVMIGPTAAGRTLVVPLVPAGEPGIWRPITAFQANRHHIQRYEEEIQ